MYQAMENGREEMERDLDRGCFIKQSYIAALGLSLTEAAVYAILRSYTEKYASGYTGARAFIARRIGCSQRSVTRALSVLSARGLVERGVVYIMGQPFVAYRASLATEAELISRYLAAAKPAVGSAAKPIMTGAKPANTSSNPAENSISKPSKPVEKSINKPSKPSEGPENTPSKPAARAENTLSKPGARAENTPSKPAARVEKSAAEPTLKPAAPDYSPSAPSRAQSMPPSMPSRAPSSAPDYSPSAPSRSTLSTFAPTNRPTPSTDLSSAPTPKSPPRPYASPPRSHRPIKYMQPDLSAEEAFLRALRRSYGDVDGDDFRKK